MTSMKSRVSRRLTSLSVAGAVALAIPATAFAQGAQGGQAQGAAAAGGSANCPPGSWFCGNAQAGAGAGASTGGGAGAAAGSSAGLQPLPGEGGGASGTPAAPPVVVYQPAPPVVVVQGKTDSPAPYEYKPRPPHKRRSEWGLNLRMEGAMIGSGKSDNAGMGGLGLGLRYRPAPVIGIEADVDFLGGHDYNGDKRGESSLTFNGLVFVNPRSRAQFYFLGGFGWQGARVTHDFETASSAGSYDSTYSYFSMQGGFGVEFRVAKHFALNLALVGFIRGRTDRDSQSHPEFTDATGRTTNTSGGGLFQGGMTFYF
jgi:hypothetical protein